MLRLTTHHHTNSRIRSRLSWVLIAVLVIAGAAGMYGFLSSQHYSRVALEFYEPVTPTSLYSTIPEHTSEIAVNVREVIAILEPNNMIRRRYDLPIVQTDDPDVCLAAYGTGKVMDCYGMALSAISMLNEKGITTRLWSITGTDGFGGNGHNVIEYYDPQSNRWEMIDPNYSCYFTKTGDSSVLDVAQLRELLLIAPAAVNVHFYGSAVELRSSQSLIEEYRSLMPTASVYTTTDFRERYRTRYGILMPFASRIDELPLSAQRGIRSFIMGPNDKRLLIADRHTPEYHLAFLKTLWYLSLAGFMLGTSFATFRLLRQPRVMQYRSKMAQAVRRTLGLAKS